MEVDSKTSSLDLFIKNYYAYCMTLIHDQYYGSVLQKSKETLALFLDEDERIESILNQIFVSFIKNLDLTYENYKFITDEKDDINSYILFLITKTQ